MLPSFYGVRTLRPPVCPVVLAWDLSLVRHAFTCVPFKTLRSATLKDFMLKTVFLVAIISAWHLSELQALLCQDPFLSFSPEGVTTRAVPSFLPKILCLSCESGGGASFLKE